MMTRIDRSPNMVREREEETSQIDFHPLYVKLQWLLV